MIAEGVPNRFCAVLVEESSGHRTIVRQRDSRMWLRPDDLTRETVCAGRALHLDGHEATIIGVASQEIEFGSLANAEIWVPLELDEHTHAGIAAAYCAGAARLPFAMLRGYLGTDLADANPRIRSVECPFTGERLAAVPAINPDVTILHAQRADRQGNVELQGIVGAQREAAFAARTLVVTAEDVVDALPPAMNGIVLPHWIVSAVAHCPGGAYPSYAQGRYPRDNGFYQRWDAIARDRATFRAWMERHVLGNRDHAAFLKSLEPAA